MWPAPPISAIISANLVASVVSVVVTVGVYLAIARVRWKPPLGESVIGSLCSAYVNAGNLGIPIALYVLGDISLMAPTLLLQLLVITPTSLALLDADRSGGRPSLSPGFAASPATRSPSPRRPGSCSRWRLPTSIPTSSPGCCSRSSWSATWRCRRCSSPSGSRCAAPKPGAAGSRAHVATLVGLKLVFQPIVAIAVGYAAVGLRGTALFAAAVTAALPTAQNVFTYANTYRRATVLARDAIFVSTFLSVPVILLISLFFRGTG